MFIPMMILFKKQLVEFSGFLVLFDEIVYCSISIICFEIQLKIQFKKKSKTENEPQTKKNTHKTKNKT